MAAKPMALFNCLAGVDRLPRSFSRRHNTEVDPYEEGPRSFGRNSRVHARLPGRPVPYEQLERWARQVAKRPEVRQVGDQLAASTSRVSDTAARTASSVVRHASDVATQATQTAAETVTHGIDKAGQEASERVDDVTSHLGN